MREPLRILLRRAAATVPLALAWGIATAGDIDLRLNRVVADAGPVVDIQAPPGDSERLFLVLQSGRIRILSDGTLQAEPFLDISSRLARGGNEQGLLGLAFAPDFADSGRFYVDYTRGLDGDTVVSRFTLGENPDRADRDSEQVLLTVDQPFSNHNGGQIAFGPDGMLHIAVGDGGGAGDPFSSGQNPGDLRGAILRIDVSGDDAGYDIPPDNPFVGDDAGRDEIWAYGLRNPWRFSFDPLTGDLFIADVGQNRFEEVNFESAENAGGRNYGWNIMEASSCFESDSCNQEGLVLPVAEYGRGQGCSITGGYMYRGALYPELRGHYLYGDFCSGRIWGLRRVDGQWQARVLADTDLSISSFGTDARGNIYVADIATGSVHLLSDGPQREQQALIDGGFSGTWFNPEQAGHGLLLEVRADGGMDGFWFTYDSDGRPFWIGANGRILGDRAVLDAFTATGGRFGPEIDPEQVETQDWGTFELTFEDCNSGKLVYESDTPMGSGEIELQRLTRLAGSACGAE